jgi:TRAP-type C4-dicarboxylate transport system substrate-binding protein
MTEFRRRDVIAGAGALAASAAMPSLAWARDYNLTIVSASPVQFVWNKVIADHFIPEVTNTLKAAGDNVTWKQLFGTTVKRGGEIQAVRDGAADLAFPTLTAYVSELPLQNLSYVLPYGAEDMNAVSAAMHELSMTEPAFRDTYARYDNTYIANYVTPSYQLWTKFPVKSVEDLKGVKLGCSGLTAGWVKGTGAVPVEQHIPGFYNDIKNGVFDGALTWLWVGAAIKLAEVAPHVTLVNFGAVCPSSITVNSKLWASSPALKDACTKGGQRYMAEVITQQQKLETDAHARISAAGGKIREVPFAERVKWAAACDEVPAEWAEAVEKTGLPAKAALKRYVGLLGSKGVKMTREWKI